MTNKSEAPTPTPKKGTRTKRLALFFFNPRVWFGLDNVRSVTTFFLSFIEQFLVLQPKNKKGAETFKQAVAKFDLDETALKTKSMGLKRLSYILVTMAGFLFLYCLYQFCFGSFRSALIAFVEVGVALVLAFRYHFWHFQIEHRKLGCSIKEWFKESFTGERP